jgi:ubiquinone biosynthesis protein COQ4
MPHPLYYDINTAILHKRPVRLTFLIDTDVGNFYLYSIIFGGFVMTELHFSHPDRPFAKMQPLKAWRHFRKLIANKEDTEQVFHIIAALSGSKFRKMARKFWETPKGRALLESNERLIDMLDDHDSIKKLPEGTVGRAYVDFMEREGLSAAGLEAEYAQFQTSYPMFGDVVERYGDRLRDTHDMLHILTGYGRDALGEQCVLLFTHGQSPSHGHLLIGYAGAAQIKKLIKGSAAPIFGAVRQAHRTGQGTPQLIAQPIRQLLERPLADVRAELRIPEPAVYRECHRIWQAEGVDPFDLLAKAEPRPELLAA